MKIKTGLTLFALAVLGIPGLADTTKVETGIDPTALDQTIDPCTDFYQYACGNWLKQQTLPDGYSRWARSFDSINEQNLNSLKTLLESYAAGGGKVPAIAAGGKVGDFYSACMDTNAAEAVTKTQLPQELALIDQVQKPEDLAPAVAALHLKGVDAFFSFSSDRDYQNVLNMIAVLDRGGMGLPDRDYYLNSNADVAKQREEYVAHVARTFVLAGATENDAQAQAATVMKIETALATASLPKDARRDPKAVYHPTDTAGLKALATGFDWDAYFKATGAPAIGKLNTAEPAFLTALGSLIANTSLADVKTYLRWEYLRMASGSLNKAFYDENFSFYGKVLSGLQKQQPRWKICVNSTSTALGEAVGEAYVKTSFNEASKQQTLDLVNNLHAAVMENFDSVAWMDAPTRAKAKEKLSAMIKKIGYPNTFKDYASMPVSRGSYLQNSEAAATFVTKEALAKIGKATNRDEWEMTPQTVNAYFEPTINEIVFPAAILQSPFYNVANPLAWNYGGIGMVIGHETTHAFDDQGRHFDSVGNLADWWTPQAAAAFEERAQCLVNQYNQYTVSGGVHLNGKLTLGENIADLGGLKLSYAAYQKTREQNPVADFAGFNDEQQFFVAFAQGWCTQSTPQYDQLQAKTNEHSNSRYRVNGVVTNIPAFQKAFSCPTGAALAPANRCEIW